MKECDFINRFNNALVFFAFWREIKFSSQLHPLLRIVMSSPRKIWNYQHGRDMLRAL